jgi:hemerythrin
MLVHWQESFELGHPVADAEHREVVDLLNKLDALLAGDGPSPTIIDALESLLITLARHFEQECPPYRQILARAQDIHRAWCNSATIPSRDDIRMLAHWWLLHLCHHIHGTAQVAP